LSVLVGHWTGLSLAGALRNVQAGWAVSRFPASFQNRSFQNRRFQIRRTAGSRSTDFESKSNFMNDQTALTLLPLCVLTLIDSSSLGTRSSGRRVSESRSLGVSESLGLRVSGSRGLRNQVTWVVPSNACRVEGEGASSGCTFFSAPAKLKPVQWRTSADKSRHSADLSAHVFQRPCQTQMCPMADGRSLCAPMPRPFAAAAGTFDSFEPRLLVRRSSGRWPRRPVDTAPIESRLWLCFEFELPKWKLAGERETAHPADTFFSAPAKLKCVQWRTDADKSRHSADLSVHVFQRPCQTQTCPMADRCRQVAK